MNPPRSAWFLAAVFRLPDGTEVKAVDGSEGRTWVIERPDGPIDDGYESAMEAFEALAESGGPRYSLGSFVHERDPRLGRVREACGEDEVMYEVAASFLTIMHWNAWGREPMSAAETACHRESVLEALRMIYEAQLDCKRRGWPVLEED